jgi:DNA-binding PucR family transcriptional regulator
MDQLRTFAHHVFGGFLNHGKGNEAEYLSTLACYFRRNSSLQAVAGDLRVHPNTVRYRIRRVEELAALDLSDYRDRLMAQVALEILDLLGDLP